MALFTARCLLFPKMTATISPVANMPSLLWKARMYGSQSNNLKEVNNMKENQFETTKRLDDNGREYWSSRELAKELEYADYRNFLTVINKAKVACQNSCEVIHG